MAPIRTSSFITEGTVLIKVTSAAPGTPRRWRAFSTTITFPPQVKVANISNTERSKQIEVENRTPAISSAEKTECAQCTNAGGLRCEMATPLGWPVEPEV